jgi:hypothetical protein
MTSFLRFLVFVSPFSLQGGEEVGGAGGAEEFVVLDHGGDSDAGGGERVFDADDTGGEADADGIGKGDMGRKGQSDVELGPGGNSTVKIKKDATGADILGFGVELIDALEANDGGETHIEAPHHPSFL